MDKWLSLMVEAINVFFTGCAVMGIAGLVFAVGFHIGAAMGLYWWPLCFLALFGAIVGYAWWEASRSDDHLIEFWAGKR